MCNIDLNEKERILSEIRNQIDSCFDGNGNFASHQNDEDRARRIVQLAATVRAIRDLREIAVYHLLLNFQGVDNVFERVNDIIQKIENFNEN